MHSSQTKPDQTADRTRLNRFSQPDAVPVAEAAARLGLTTDAVRMRVRRGQLASVRRAGRLFVLLTPEETTPDQPLTQQDQTETEPVTSGPNTARDELIDALRSEVAHLRSELVRVGVALERSQAGEAELRRLLAMQTPALAAAPAPETAADAPATTGATQTPRRPWWAFWRG